MGWEEFPHTWILRFALVLTILNEVGGEEGKKRGGKIMRSGKERYTWDSDSGTLLSFVGSLFVAFWRRDTATTWVLCLSVIRVSENILFHKTPSSGPWHHVNPGSNTNRYFSGQRGYCSGWMGEYVWKKGLVMPSAVGIFGNGRMIWVSQFQ